MMDLARSLGKTWCVRSSLATCIAGSTVAYSAASSNEDEACTDTTCGTTDGRQFGKEAHEILEKLGG